jgi:hypothetical protein
VPKLSHSFIVLIALSVASTPGFAAMTYRAFITSTKYNGNLGGLAGADAKCAARAAAAGLGGEWVAFLSDSGANALDRISDGVFVRVDGERLGDSVADLFDGSIEVPLNIDESGAATGQRAWTGTVEDGSTHAALCSDWTTSGASPRGRAGAATRTDEHWASYYGYHCNETHSLYCFEVGECPILSEGVACDDEDPGTAYSYCVAGACTAATPSSSVVVEGVTTTLPDLIPGAGNEPEIAKLRAIPFEDAPDTSALPKGASFPVGLFDLAIVHVPVGGSVTVDVDLPMEIHRGLRLYKHLGAAGWLNVTEDAQVVFEEGQTSYQITLTDGGYGDADGVADGIIEDPMGPLNDPTAIPTLGEWAVLLSLLLLAGLAVTRLRRGDTPAI